VADSVTASDAVTRLGTFLRALADALGLSDTITGEVPLAGPFDVTLGDSSPHGASLTDAAVGGSSVSDAGVHDVVLVDA
jgi:hypothetical protein